jgi:hypothetical protein
VPEVKLTRARDGSSGTAIFFFAEPDVFEAANEGAGEITGLYLVDSEGTCPRNAYCSLLARAVCARTPGGSAIGTSESREGRLLGIRHWQEAPPAGDCAGPPRRAAEPPLTWKFGARARNSVPHARAQKPRNRTARPAPGVRTQMLTQAPYSLRCFAGTLSTVDVSAKFVNGKPKGIEWVHARLRLRHAACADKRGVPPGQSTRCARHLNGIDSCASWSAMQRTTVRGVCSCGNHVFFLWRRRVESGAFALGQGFWLTRRAQAWASPSPRAGRPEIAAAGGFGRVPDFTAERGYCVACCMATNELTSRAARVRAARAGPLPGAARSKRS